jgi:CRP/FNR family transcriptional regulator, cyclic AMP receptor protein
MKTDKGVEVLVRQGWLSMTPLEFQVRVLAECVLSEHAAGETIYRIGDPPGGIYGVLAGSFGISFASNEAGPHLAHFVRRGGWVGEAAAVTDLPRRVGLVAVRETKTAYLPLPAIRQITSAQPITWRYFAFLSLLNLDIAMGAAADLLLRDPRNRCIAALLRLGNCRTVSQPGTDAVEVEIGQGDLAILSNLSRNAVGTIIRSLEAQGMIALSYRRIIILKPDNLRQALKV